jgi:hypothetical protein
MSEFDRLAGELAARFDSLVDSTFARLGERLPGWEVASAFGPAEVDRFARASLRTQLRAFRRQAVPERAPELDIAAAKAIAKVGELRALMNGYWAAQSSLWEAWLDLVDATGLSMAERRLLLDRGSDFFFRYAGLLGDCVLETYQRELQRNAGGAEGRRLQAINGLLDGDLFAAPGLDLDLDQYHLALLAWGEAGEAAARELASSLQRPLLIVAALDRSWWGWISGSRQFDLADERTLECFQPGPGAALALGLQAFGEVGFRASHRQAQRARWAARRGAPTLIHFSDVAVESLAGENREEARAFVAHELRGIADDSAPSERIRETLAAYFAAEHNAASAAATLGIHQQTVANRLRAAEERLGHPVGTRRVELELALRLRATMAPEDS